MKLEIEDEEKCAGRMNDNDFHYPFEYPSSIPHMNHCFNDFYMAHPVSRVEYQREFYSEDKNLLNLDHQNKRKASEIGSNFDEKSPYSELIVYDSSEKTDFNLEGWIHKAKEDWQIGDTINWLIWAGTRLGHTYERMPHNLAMRGEDLLRLTREDFYNYDQSFGGKLYDMLHERNDLPSFDTFKSLSDDELSVGSSNNYSDYKESPNLVDSGKKRPGRPRILDPKKKVAKVKLWEFVRDLLLNPKYCPGWICWDNYEKKRFRFVQSESVAKLWGDRKNNTKMTYEKFSRAMRYYYPKQIFVSVPGRRLVYDFGKNATGLETNNPNFEKQNFYRNVVESEKLII